MGYTRYWNRTDKPITQEFVDEVNRIIAQAKAKGITVCGWDGTGEPEVTLDCIAFNGKAPHMNHEICGFDNDERSRGFACCKTARKPYDYVVKRVLMAAKRMGIVEDTSSDGQNSMTTDAEYEVYLEEIKKKYPQWFEK